MTEINYAEKIKEAIQDFNAGEITQLELQKIAAAAYAAAAAAAAVADAAVAVADADAAVAAAGN